MLQLVGRWILVDDKSYYNGERGGESSELRNNEEGGRGSIRAGVPGTEEAGQRDLRPEEGADDRHEIKIKGKRTQ